MSLIDMILLKAQNSFEVNTFPIFSDILLRFLISPGVTWIKMKIGNHNVGRGRAENRSDMAVREVNNAGLKIRLFRNM